MALRPINAADIFIVVLAPRDILAVIISVFPVVRPVVRARCAGRTVAAVPAVLAPRDTIVSVVIAWRLVLMIAPRAKPVVKVHKLKPAVIMMPIVVWSGVRPRIVRRARLVREGCACRRVFVPVITMSMAGRGRKTSAGCRLVAIRREGRRITGSILPATAQCRVMPGRRISAGFRLTVRTRRGAAVVLVVTAKPR